MLLTSLFFLAGCALTQSEKTTENHQQVLVFPGGEPIPLKPGEKVLDSRKQAQPTTSVLGGDEVTNARFRQMQHSFDSKSFYAWEQKLAQLKAGMERGEVYRTLGLDERHSLEDGRAIVENGMWFDDIQLSDAYYTTVAFGMVGQKNFMQWATTPCAMRYHIVPAKKAP